MRVEQVTTKAVSHNDTVDKCGLYENKKEIKHLTKSSNKNHREDHLKLCRYMKTGH